VTTLVGAGYRPELPGIFDMDNPAVDCAELVADRYFGEGGFCRSWELRSLAGLPVIAHGLSGNTASFLGPDLSYLEQIRHLVDDVDAITYSDHLALTAVAGRELGHLAPNLFDDELLEAAAGNIRRMVEVTGRRVCLENLATTTMISGSTYNPEEFYLAMLGVSDQWDCLLDLTNVWINSQNRAVDPEAFVDAIPPERIGYIHLAGGTRLHGELVDTHSHAVHVEVFDLLDRVLQRATPQAIIIERDSNWEGAEEELRSDVARVRSIVSSHQSPVDRAVSGESPVAGDELATLGANESRR
jgi:uncharacterized protein